MPRPPPPALDRLPGTRWPDVAAYWDAPWDEQPRAAEKYRAMSEALAGDEAERKVRLAAIARRFPGALREAQLTLPEHYRARIAASEAPSIRTRAAWAAAGLAAVPLWADLHGLLVDVARMRASPADPFAALAPDRRGWWPARPELWPAWVLRRFDPRLAQAWLAALAGLDPHALDLALRR